MTATMRALRAHDLIDPPGMWVDEVELPARPDEDAVRIDVHAAGVGFDDTLVTRGMNGSPMVVQGTGPRPVPRERESRDP